MMDAAVVTGVGAFTSLGPTSHDLWQAIRDGRDGFRATSAGRLRTASFARFAAAWLDDVAVGSFRRTETDPCAQLALVAALEAFRDARLHDGAFDAARLALVLGTSAGGLMSRSTYELGTSLDEQSRHRLLDQSRYEAQTDWVAERLGITGPRLTVSTACTSSVHAVAHARDLIEMGAADHVVAGGVDLVAEEVFAGFVATEAMSESPCSPFGAHTGMSLGEGAAFVVLERASVAAARGANVYARLAGYGFSSDAYHPTAPDPTGVALARAMASALEDACLAPDDVDYLSAHGTGTEANDAAEARAIQRVLGHAASRVAVASSKGHVGHTLGAAGAIELVITLLAMREASCPPSLRSSPSRAFAPAGVVSGERPRPASIRCAVKSGAAFGGTNAALVVVRPPAVATEHAAARATSREPIVIVGAGVVGAHGARALDDVLRAQVPCFSAPNATPRRGQLPALVGHEVSVELGSLGRRVDPRGLDRTARLLLASSSMALDASRLAATGSLRDRLGLFVASTMVPWDTADELWDSIRERGFERISAPAFSRIVMNAAAGAVSRALSLRGPTSVLVGGAGTSLAALSLASHALVHRRDADALCVASADELSTGGLEDHASRRPSSTRPRDPRPFAAYDVGDENPVVGECAVSVVLATARLARERGLSMRAYVAGCAVDGPARLASCVARALDAAGCAPDELDAVYGSADGRRVTAAREQDALSKSLGPLARELPLSCPSPLLGATQNADALALAAALEALRVGRAHPTAGGSSSGWNLTGRWHRPVRTVLVIGAHERSGSAATVLRHPEETP